jgi:predicted AAA+ superfamily ATPase
MIKRDILEKIVYWLKKDKILVLKGARQVGKTTLLKEIEKYAKKSFPEIAVSYLDASNPLNKAIFESTLSLERYLSQNFNFPNQFVFCMIDEFQTIENSGMFLKNVFDEYKGQLQLIVSGSSSLEITKNTEFLTGRSLDFDIERITFFEYINYSLKTKIKSVSLENFSDLESFYKIFKSRIDPFFNEYVTFGGYPEVITTNLIEDKKIILEAIIKKYLEKDVADFLRVENVTAFNNLSKVLCAQIGSLVNKSELANTLNISSISVDKYLDILAGTYIFDFCRPYFKNVRKEISKMPKAYVLDLGIKSYLQKMENIQEVPGGDTLENFVYLAIIAQFSKNSVYFYRTTAGSEIDFIIEKDNRKLILCESKYSNNPRAPLAMQAFVQKYPEQVEKRVIITKDVLKQQGNIYFIPASIFPFVRM